MTFSSKAKNEISRVEIDNDCCLIAELSAIVRMNGSLDISGINKISLSFTTENASIARRIFSLIKSMYNVNLETGVRKNNKLKKKNNYLIVLNNDSVARKVINDIGLVLEGSNIYYPDYSIPEGIVNNRCCKRSYIRGAFLGAGSVSNPERDYHMEFVNSDEIHANDLAKLINFFDLNAKVIERKGRYVTYIKEAGQIADLLNVIGAHQTLLKFEDVRVLKDMRNNINRLVNCETANLSKTVNASMRQIQNIKIIDDAIGLDKMPLKLREVAEIRLANRDLSLKEIGEELNPVVSKSGVNHRFRRIEKMAEDIEEGKVII